MTKVQKVPMPEGWTRPETGVMEFGDDWPGVFIRGDIAFGYAMILADAANRLLGRPAAVTVSGLHSLAELFRSCNVNNLPKDDDQGDWAKHGP